MRDRDRDQYRGRERRDKEEEDDRKDRRPHADRTLEEKAIKVSMPTQTPNHPLSGSLHPLSGSLHSKAIIRKCFNIDANYTLNVIFQ